MTTPTLPTLRFKNDGPMRHRLFVSDAFAHPAKGHIAMWQEMVERYSKEGDTVLDVMAGIGTSLVAALMGRNVVCVELEAHFVDPMRRSWEKMRNMPMLGYTMGTATIIRGDARHLPIEWEFPPEDPAVNGPDVILTSPPYEGTNDETREYGGLKDPTANKRGGHFGPGSMAQSYTRPSAIITSPPYEGSAVADLNASPLNGPIGDASRAKDRRKGGQERLDKFGAGYTK